MKLIFFSFFLSAFSLMSLCVYHYGKNDYNVKGKNQTKKGNRRLHFARAVHFRRPLPSRQHDGGGPSRGHIENMHKNLVKIARVVPEISSLTDRQTGRQTDRPTDRHTHHNTSQLLQRAK